MAATNFEWNTNSLACVHTWAFLRGLGEFDNVFSTAGDLEMDELAYWSDVATPALQNVSARALAARLDRIFVKALLAKYEQGSSRTSALDALTTVLAKGKSSVQDLAETVDANYNFRGELK
jgi:hypothetical protein